MSIIRGPLGGYEIGRGESVPAHTLPAYTPISVGFSQSTALPDMDFETYSEAGYVWDEAKQKWRSASNGRGGIFAVGAPVYTEHPSAEVLSLAYDLKDGKGSRLWLPCMPPPHELFDHIANGGLIEAHNSGFEWLVWTNICWRKMGWPPLPLSQLRCSASKARAFSLPGSLEKGGEALGLDVQKDKEGKRLLRKFSIPRTPTKKDSRKRIDPLTDPEGTKLYSYNDSDIKAEAELSAHVPDLTPTELELWLTDQRINMRGVQIDMQGVSNCLAVFEGAVEAMTQELRALTGGQVSEASKVKDLTEWLGARGLHMPDMTADTIDNILARTDYPGLTPETRRALEIRAIMGSASVKKLYTLQRTTSYDDRLRELFKFCGADRTGRFAGQGAQPQNMPGKGPKLKQCDPVNGCGRYYNAPHLDRCTFCHTPEAFSKSVDWCPEAVEQALYDMQCRSYNGMKRIYDNPVEVIAGCIRGLFCAAPGHDLICSDYSAIEAVVLAALAGEQWRLDVFNSHGKIYEMSAAKITGIPFDDFMRHKQETGEHHVMRKKIGKVAELACFAPDTQVLTNVGYVRIVDITRNHKLWDGTQWVSSDGAIHKGKREVLNVDGVKATPDHPISLGHSWRAAKELVLNKNTLTQALAIGSANLPWSGRTDKKIRGGQLSDAFAGPRSILSATLTYTKESLRVAVNAGGRKAGKRTSKNILNTPKSYRTTNTVGDSATGYPVLSGVAITQISEGIRTMVVGVSAYARNGASQKGRFSNTLKPYQDGITQSLKWIGLTLTETTNRVISGLSAVEKICSTKGQSLKCKCGSMNLSDVYDIVNAGPRNRFTIKTDSGHLIVHNSGYQGGYGAWLAFGADKHLGEQEIKDAIKAWRKESPNIVKFWYQMEDCAVSAVRFPGNVYSYNGISWTMKDDVLYCRLLSGRLLAYHRPIVRPDKTPWGKDVWKLSYIGTDKGKLVRIDTYGGKLTENVVQATARDILTHALVNCEKRNYPVVLHVHDEIASEVPEGFGSIEEFEGIMADLPHWCKDWPIKAAGGWRGKRFRKD